MYGLKQELEERLHCEGQEGLRARQAADQDLQIAQDSIKNLEERLKAVTADSEARLLHVETDAEHDKERHASQLGQLEARIAEIEAQWEAERLAANQQVLQILI